MKIKTIINGKETVHAGLSAQTRGEARQIVMGLGLCMVTDPILRKSENCWEIYCRAPQEAAA